MSSLLADVGVARHRRLRGPHPASGCIPEKARRSPRHPPRAGTRKSCIELPDGLKDSALEWLYSLRRGDRVMLRMRDSHSSGWLTQEHHFLKLIVRGCLGKENTGNRVFCRKHCRTCANRTNRRRGAVPAVRDRKSTRLNSSHLGISYA